jgi:hypothetical protein
MCGCVWVGAWDVWGGVRGWAVVYVCVCVCGGGGLVAAFFTTCFVSMHSLFACSNTLLCDRAAFAGQKEEKEETKDDGNWCSHQAVNL